MDPNDVKLTTEEHIMLMVTAIFKITLGHPVFWAVVINQVGAYFWYPHVFGNIPLPTAFWDKFGTYLGACILSFITMIGIGMVLAIVGIIACSIHEAFTAHFKEVKLEYQKKLVKDCEQKLLKK